MNYSISINPLKLKSAIADVSGKKCLIIPIVDNKLYASYDQTTNAIKSVYLSLNAWETKESKYGDSHSLKQQLSIEERKRMTEDELRAMPFLGSMKPKETHAANTQETTAQGNAENTTSTPNAPIEINWDAPF